MDRTKLFVAIVKTVKLRERDRACNLEKIKTKPVTLFCKEAQELYNRIKKLQDFLITSRKDYIDTLGFLGNKSSMKDEERDRIDMEVKEFLQACMSQANRVRELINSGGTSNEAVSVRVGTQLQRHRSLICESLDDHLKGTCKMYDDQKSIRINRIINKRKLGRLHSGIRQRKPASGINTGASVVTVNSADPVEINTAEPNVEESKLAAENEQLYASMSTMTNELRMIEGKVIEISKLQELFAEHILHQATQVDNIAGNTQEATDNVVGGNEQIRKAIKNKGTLRIWIIFILLVCSFALLFLDWYS